MVTINLNQWYSEQDCDVLADTINGVLERFCTPGSGARAWS
jgi:hypothetical protein